MHLYVQDTALKGEDSQNLVDLAVRYGLEGLILTLSADGSMSDEKKTTISRRMKEKRIPLIALRLSWNRGENVSLKPLIQRAVETGKDLDCETLILGINGFFMENSDSEVEGFVRGLEETLRHMKGSGSRLLLLLEGPITQQDVYRITQSIPSDQWGISFDPAQALWYGIDPVHELTQLHPRVKQIVLSDIRCTPGDCRMGKGIVDFGSIAEAITRFPSVESFVLAGPATLPEIVGRDASYARANFPFLKNPVRWPVFGAMTYEFPYTEGKLEDFIALLKRNKIEYIQVGKALLDELVAHPERVLSIKNHLEKEGIYFVGVAAYKNLVARDPEKLRKNIELMKMYLELAPHLGTSVVATETGTFNLDHDFRPSPKNWTAEAWKELRKTLDILVPVAEKNHSCLALEGYVNNILATLPQISRILAEYPTDAIQLVSDPCNFLHSRLLPVQLQITENFTHWFEDRLILAHIKDVNPSGAEKGTPEYGEGVFNLDRYLQFLAEKRPDLPLVLEHLPHEHMPTVMERVLRKIEELKLHPLQSQGGI
ncbi:MAG: TIM barrel protein [Spirochaetales bacterium]